MRVSPIRRFFRWVYRGRSISLTHEGTRFVLLAVAIGLAAINTGNNLLYLLLAMMLSLIVMSGVLSEQCLRRLYIQRRLPEHIFAGFPGTAYFSISNRKSRLPSFSIRVLDVIDEQPIDRGVHLLHLAPESSALRSYPLLVPRRGPFRIDGIKVLTRFPFSLFVKALALPLPSEAIAYPPIKPLPADISEQIDGLGQDNPVPKRGPGVDLYNLRLYQPGDDSRAIHWRTTAKTSLLIVRETQAEDQHYVTLAFPTAVPPATAANGASAAEMETSFEKAVELTASLAAHFQEQGFAIRAIVGDQAVPSATGEEQLYRILKVLALCQPIPAEQADAGLEGFKNLLAQTPPHEMVLLVLPWEDARLAACTAGVETVFRAHEVEAAHAR